MNTGYSKPEIEKIRKAQWTPENTRKTQKAVDGLVKTREALHWMGFPRGWAMDTLRIAIRRLKELDPAVVVDILDGD